MNSLIAARLKREHQEKEQLFNKITYGDLPLPVRKAIFETAWELGHAGGANEVELFYNDLTELQIRIQKWYKEYEDTLHQMYKSSEQWKGTD